MPVNPLSLLLRYTVRKRADGGDKRSPQTKATLLLYFYATIGILQRSLRKLYRGCL